MFNKEKKEEYLALLDTGDTITRAIFEKTAKYEEELNKDISFFTKKELLDMYKRMHYTFHTLTDRHYRIRRYILWSNEKNPAPDLIRGTDLKEACGISPNPETQVNISRSDIHKIISYSDVINTLEQMVNPLDQFLLYGLFCGIKGLRYVELEYSSMKDSDPDKRMIWLAGIDEKGDVIKQSRKFYADQRLYDYADASSKENYTYKIRKNGVKVKNPIYGDEGDIFKLTKRNSLTRGNVTEYLKNNKVAQVKLTHILNDYNMGSVGPLSVYWSGFIYNIRKIALENGLDVPQPKDAAKIRTNAVFHPILIQYGLEDASPYNLRCNLERYK